DAIAQALGASADPAGFLAGRLDRLAAFKEGLATSLARDDKRGRQVFDDYADFHDTLGSDSTLARLAQEAEALRTRLLGALKAP
ncbi:MAG TPA: hypothetical protein VK465_03575, partial [Fibrobacteria bacterium]|nr:hypothetical protein [Fibrobacteria bacterium]